MAQKKVRSCIVFGRRMACARVSQIDPVFPCHPPPAKADIATAILTKVIEHLVLLIAPQ